MSYFSHNGSRFSRLGAVLSISFVILIVLSLIVTFVLAGPNLILNNALSDGARTTNDSFLFNATVIEPSLSKITWQWNNTNYSLYNNSLVLMLNFDNLSALGECRFQYNIF